MEHFEDPDNIITNINIKHGTWKFKQYMGLKYATIKEMHFKEVKVIIVLQMRPFYFN